MQSWLFFNEYSSEVKCVADKGSALVSGYKGGVDKGLGGGAVDRQSTGSEKGSVEVVSMIIHY